jgi:hypothetical protein
MDTVAMCIEVPAELDKEIRSLDVIFDICSLDDYHHGEPEPEDADRVLSLCGAVEGLFDSVKIAEAREAAEAE